MTEANHLGMVDDIGKMDGTIALQDHEFLFQHQVFLGTKRNHSTTQFDIILDRVTIEHPCLGLNSVSEGNIHLQCLVVDSNSD